MNIARTSSGSSSGTLDSSIVGEGDSAGINCVERAEVISKLATVERQLSATDQHFARSKMNSINTFYHFSVIARHLVASRNHLDKIEPLVAGSGIEEYQQRIGVREFFDQ